MEAQAATKLEPFILVAKGSKGAATAKAIENATAAPGVFVFAELLNLPSVKELKHHETHAPWFALLNLFAYGTYSTYLASPGSYPPLNPQQLNKLKQLSVVTLGSFSRTLPYETLITTLEIANVRALEDLLIDAIFLQALKGKMDQQRACFLVDEVLGRDVSPSALKDVQQQLSDWAVIQQNLVSNLSSTITLAQSSAGEHQSQLLAYQIQRDVALDEVAKTTPAGSSNHADGRGLGSVPTPGGLGVEEDKKGKGKKPPARETASQSSHQRKRNRP